MTPEEMYEEEASTNFDYADFVANHADEMGIPSNFTPPFTFPHAWAEYLDPQQVLMDEDLQEIWNKKSEAERDAWLEDEPF